MKFESTSRFFLVSFLTGSLLAGFAAIGMVIGQYASTLGTEIPVDATGSAWSETMCAATGSVDEEMEGLFTLDCLTGDLQCVVLNSRTTKFAGMFRTNVLNDLGVDATKKPSFLMVTGTAQFPGQGGNVRPGNSVVYVADSTSGHVAVYGVPWQRTIAARGGNQNGQLILLDVTTARNVMLRE